MTFRFSTKARTLEALIGQIKAARVLPLSRFSVADWRLEREEILGEVYRQLGDVPLIVRSSAAQEDSKQASLAGHYLSICDVRGNADLAAAIERVIDSYGPTGDLVEDEVLVQPMLTGITMAGVVLTADMDTLAPYYIINYDEQGGCDSVTSGGRAPLATFVAFKHAPHPPKDKRLARVVELCRELEDVCGYAFLDIEFAFDESGELFLLQVRPLVTDGKDDLSVLDLCDPLLKIYKKVTKLTAPHPNLLGEKALFGVMPDWNPAEIIGLRPRQLALSLYKELVTDSIWAYQRDRYGYRNLRSHPLMASFLGMPYIDVRVDFNSFIPASLDERIAARLVEYYLAKLQEKPQLHDKVEFEIIHSCYYLNLPERLEELHAHGFSRHETKRIEFALLELTNSVIASRESIYRQDLKRIEILKQKHTAILGADLSRIDTIYWLVEECKRYGTLPFAGVARAAFIAVQLLKSFVASGIMTEEEYQEFLASLNTVAKGLSRALAKVGCGELSRDEFLWQFGHLRPGTYDILSPRYDEAFELYFQTLPTSCEAPSTYIVPTKLRQHLDDVLPEHGLRCTADQLLGFIVEAIEGREHAKFVFTRTLSEILREVSLLGEACGLTRDKLSYLDIRTLLGLYASLDHRDLRTILEEDICRNRELHQHTLAVRLPALISTPEDIYGFYLGPEEPNYITNSAVSGEVVREEDLQLKSVKGKIVFIRSADPGYDFLFAHEPAGLVTQFGGANSHMAIRCAESGIPAVIGAGEKNYALWKTAHVLALDCAGRQVRTVS